MHGCAATVSMPCSSCAGQGIGRVYETIVNGRLHWVLTHDCPDGLTESMGWDETPEELRQAIITQCGTYRLRFARDVGDARVAVMKVLHGTGVAMSDLPATLAALAGAGMPGTEAESELLAGRLRDAGADVVVVSD